jgi:hypothetical protein
MVHMMRYIGRYEINFKNLQPNPHYYMNPVNKKIPIPLPPTNFCGIMFYMMEDMTSGRAEPLIVMVENIVLGKPVTIDYKRHTGDEKRVGPRGKKLMNESANNLLDDVINKNPGLKNALASIKRNRL